MGGVTVDYYQALRKAVEADDMDEVFRLARQREGKAAAASAAAPQRTRSGMALECASDEVLHMMATLDRLYEQRHRGDDTVYTAQKIRRWELLLTALQGDATVIAQRECHC